MELLFIRHASTNWNLEKRCQGSADTPLSEEGKLQPAAWKSFLPADPSAVFTSPLKRARETAALLYPSIQAEVHEALREMSLGSWEGRLMSEVRAEIDSREWRGMDFSDHGGESMRDVVGRLEAWLKTMPECPEKKVVVVSHKVTITACYCLATGWQADSKPEERLRFPRAHRFYWNGKLNILRLNEPLGDS